MNGFVELLNKVSGFLTKDIDFLELGSYAPAGYVAAIGVVALAVAFFIALIAKNRSKISKILALYEDASAYVNAVGAIDEENVGGLFQKIAVMPHFVVKGWDSFMNNQTGYPSDYITEKDLAVDKQLYQKSMGAKTFFMIASWLILAVCFGFMAIASKEMFTLEVEDIAQLSAGILGGLCMPLIAYIILGGILSARCNALTKKLIAAFREFQDALDNNVMIFREEQDEFISENIEEINATIEEILANRLDDKEIIEIVTTPRVETANEFIPEPINLSFEGYEEPIRQEVVRQPVQPVQPVRPVQPVVTKTYEPEPEPIYDEIDEEREQRQHELLSLVHATDDLIQDPNTTKQDIGIMAQMLERAKESGRYRAKDEQEIFITCLQLLSRAYDA